MDNCKEILKMIDVESVVGSELEEEARAGWDETTLKNITTKIGSGATPRGGSNDYKQSGISLIRSQNVLDLQFSVNGLVYIDDEQAFKLKNVTVEQGDILLNITGDSVARVCKVPDKVLPARVNQHVAIIRADPEKALPDFILYHLISKKEELLMQSEIGATRKAITKSMIEDFPISLPPLPEQRAIASVLSSLDDKIDLLHRQNGTLEKMAEKLFRQGFLPAGRQGVEEAEKQGKVGLISDLIDFNPSRRISKGQNAPYLEMAELNTSTYAPSSWYFREFSSGSKFQNGDALLARITPCLENGKAAYIDFLEEEQIGWGSTEFIVMRTRSNLHPFFSYVVTRNEDFKDFAESCMQGSSGRQRVDVENLKSFEIAIPPPNVIEGFNNFCDSIVPKLKSNQTQIRTLTALRDTLLPKLMSGEVRVEINPVETDGRLSLRGRLSPRES